MRGKSMDKRSAFPQPARMKPICPRLAARALILHDDRLLLVNAYGGGISDLWCAPGGGVERGTSLPANLIREVHEETGLTVAVGDPAQGGVFIGTERSKQTIGHGESPWRSPAQKEKQRGVAK